MNKILIIDNSPSITGAFKSIFSATGQLASEYEFIYFCPPCDEIQEELSKAEIKKYDINFLELSKNLSALLYLPKLIFNTLKILRYINREKIDIVHVNDIYNMTGVILKILKPNLKLVYHVRLLPNSYAKSLYGFWKKQIQKKADQIICVSESVASNFDNKKVRVIYDAIESSNEPHETGKDNTDVFKILYLANYIPGKGHKDAIDAYKLALPKIKNSKLIFYGGTLNMKKNKLFKNHLIEYVNGLGLNDNIEFNGFSDNIAGTIQDADLMLNFSESESFSMTTLEALWFGTPIIATDSGGPGEIVENGKSGILVPVNDINAMSNSIVKLGNSDEIRKELAINGIERVRSKFSLEKQANKLNDIYNKLLQGNNMH
ncbi:MAG: glycosyltransferase family 4 protein [Bacteroidota bacterium]